MQASSENSVCLPAGLTMLAGVLVMLIAAILFRRILIISGVDVTSLM